MKVAACLLTAAALLAAGCNKAPPPKADAAKEQAEATKRAKDRAYGGDAVKALEAAKSLEADVNKQAIDAIEKAEKAQ